MSKQRDADFENAMRNGKNERRPDARHVVQKFEQAGAQGLGAISRATGCIQLLV